SQGLADVLAHGTAWNALLQDTPLENLKMLSTGGEPHNPAELLSTERMQNVLMSARAAFDIVIVDAPIALAIADVPILAPAMDGVLLVHSPTKGNKEAVLEAKKMLQGAGANLVGMISNNLSVNEQKYYYRSYQYQQQYAYKLPAPQRQSQTDLTIVDMR